MADKKYKYSYAVVLHYYHDEDDTIKVIVPDIYNCAAFGVGHADAIRMIKYEIKQKLISSPESCFEPNDPEMVKLNNPNDEVEIVSVNLDREVKLKSFLEN